MKMKNKNQNVHRKNRHGRRRNRRNGAQCGANGSARLRITPKPTPTNGNSFTTRTDPDRAGWDNKYRDDPVTDESGCAVGCETPTWLALAFAAVGVALLCALAYAILK